MTKLSTKKIAQAIFEASQEREGKDLDIVIKTTAEFLTEKKMVGKSPEILQHLEKMIDEKEGIIRAHIETAHHLDHETIDLLKKHLIKRYKAKDIKMEIVENKDHIGGIKIQVNDEVINLTIAKRLHQLENYLNSQV